MKVRLINARRKNQSLESWLKRIKDKPLYYFSNEIDPEGYDDNICPVCGSTEGELTTCECCDATMCDDCYGWYQTCCPEHAIPDEDPCFAQDEHRYSSQQRPRRDESHKDRIYLYVKKEIVDKVLGKWYSLIMKNQYGGITKLLEDANPYYDDNCCHVDSSEFKFFDELSKHFYAETVKKAWEVLKPVNDYYPQTQYKVTDNITLYWVS